MRLRPRGLNNGRLRMVERTSEGGEVVGGCQGPGRRKAQWPEGGNSRCEAAGQTSPQG